MDFGVQVSSQAYRTEICKQRLDLIVGHVGHEGLHVGSCENLLKYVKKKNKKNILAAFKSEGVGLNQTVMSIMYQICL